MLQAHGINLSIGGKKILRDVEFSLPQKEITVLLGKNGSGKSTLFSCIGGRLPYRGDILLDGKNIKAVSPRERAKKLSILPQILPSPDITVEQLAVYGRNPYLGLGKRLSSRDHEAVFRALEQSGASLFRHKLVSTLSGGERQKAYIAMILAQNTPLILLDEPTTYMDMEYRAEFLNFLSDLNKIEGKTIFAVMHDLTEAVGFAQNIMLLENGRLTFCGKTESCLEKGAIEQAFHVKKCLLPMKNGAKKVFFYGE